MDQTLIVTPPVQSDLLGLVDGADQETDFDGQEFDVGERYSHVTRDDEALVQHPIQNIDEAGRLMWRHERPLTARRSATLITGYRTAQGRGSGRPAEDQIAW